MIACTCVNIVAVLFADELEQAVKIWVLVHFIEVLWCENLHLDVFFENGKTRASLALILYNFIFCNQQLDAKMVLVNDVLQALGHGPLYKCLWVNQHASILQHLLGLGGLRLEKVKKQREAPAHKPSMHLVESVPYCVVAFLLGFVFLLKIFFFFYASEDLSGFEGTHRHRD